MAEHNFHPKYRSDIDGLRALAILPVVAYHAFPRYAPGGFIGVDIFFVISGYLISLIIFRSLLNNDFSFAEFYAHRIKRIFPALMLVSATCYVVGWFALLPDEFKQLGKHITAGMGFVQNFVLWKEAGYFDVASELKPLMHLWSLAVEEQFYLIFPLLVWAAWKARLNVLTGVIALGVISFILNLKGIDKDSIKTFFAPQTRFWELMAGSVLAYVYGFRVWRPSFARWIHAGIFNRLFFREVPAEQDRSVLLSSILSFLGLALIVYSIAKYNHTMPYPGVRAVAPVLGAVLLILAGPHAWVNRKILSRKVVVWVGLISYPLYLWHWPLLSFARIAESETPSRNIRIAAVAISFVLAALTYYLIEKRVRYGRSTWRKVAVLSVLAVLVGYVGYNANSRDGLAFREVAKLNVSLNSEFGGDDHGNMANECNISSEEARKLFAMCARDKRGNVRFALMGDSKAHALYSGLVRSSKENGRWLFIGGNGPNGAPFPLLKSYPDPSRPLTNIAVEAISKNNEIEVVALVTAIRAIFSLSDGVKALDLKTYDYKYLERLESSNRFDDAFDEFNRVVQILILAGKKIVIVVDNPALPNPQDCIARIFPFNFANRLLGKSKKSCSIPVGEFKKQIKKYSDLLVKIKTANPNSVYIFDPTDIYCNGDGGACGAIRDGRLMYSFTDHISDYAAGIVGAELNEFILKKVIGKQ